MIVKALKIPVRYKGKTYPAGQFFKMEEDHFDENIVKEATDEEAEEVAKYSKAADRTRVPAKTEEVDYSTFTKSKLESVKKDDLKAYLDAKGVQYAEDAEKKDFIKAILGE